VRDYEIHSIPAQEWTIDSNASLSASSGLLEGPPSDIGGINQTIYLEWRFVVII